MAQADKRAAQAAGATYVDTARLFCTVDVCPPFAGTTPIRFDSTHLTETYAQRIAPATNELISNAIGQ